MYWKIKFFSLFFLLFTSLCFAFDYYELKREYKAWVFINWKQDLTGGGLCSNTICDMHYWLVEISDYEQFAENYFPDISIKRLEKRWLNKPMPEGLEDFLKYKVENKYVLED